MILDHLVCQAGPSKRTPPREPLRGRDGSCMGIPMLAAILPRSPFALVLVGLALTTLLLSGTEPPHAHDDGIYNEECTVSALAALGSCAALVELAPVVVVAPPVAEASISGDLATPGISGSSVGPRAPPRA
jgi:hypothetical protein